MYFKVLNFSIMLYIVIVDLLLVNSGQEEIFGFTYIYIYIGEEGEGKGERERNEEGERRERKASLYFCSAILYSIPASLRCGKHGCDHYYAGLYQNTIICPYTELPGDGS